MDPQGNVEFRPIFLMLEYFLLENSLILLEIFLDWCYTGFIGVISLLDQ